MPKYRDYFRRMTDENQEMFAEFAEVHAKYQQDKSEWQSEFNEKGVKVVEVVREWEGRLCGHSEKGDKSVFSARLADKFWGEVKAFFPLIDFVGVEVVKQGKQKKTLGESKNQKNTEMKSEEEEESMDSDLWEIERITLDSTENFDIKRIKMR